MSSFYAVARGKTTGIFTTWQECSESIKGYKNAKYKKFETESDANAFILKYKLPDNITTDSESILPKRVISLEEVDNPPDYFVYTDGACTNNGKHYAKAGYGIFFGIDDPRNVSKEVDPKYPKTNNVAELSAIIETYFIIEQDIKAGKQIIIVTDSEYCIKCVSSYGEKCSKKEWNIDMPNKELVRQLYDAYLVTNVQFMHIMAHTGREDVHSLGNEWADRLANKAIGITECPYNENNKKREQKIYLKVSFEEKDKAKVLGAKWDFRKKKWYIDANNENKKELVEKYGL